MGDAESLLEVGEVFLSSPRIVFLRRTGHETVRRLVALRDDRRDLLVWRDLLRTVEDGLVVTQIAFDAANWVSSGSFESMIWRCSFRISFSLFRIDCLAEARRRWTPSTKSL